MPEEIPARQTVNNSGLNGYFYIMESVTFTSVTFSGLMQASDLTIKVHRVKAHDISEQGSVVMDYKVLTEIGKMVEREIFYAALITIVGGKGKRKYGMEHLNNARNNAKAFNNLSGLPYYAVE